MGQSLHLPALYACPGSSAPAMHSHAKFLTAGSQRFCRSPAVAVVRDTDGCGLIAAYSAELFAVLSLWPGPLPFHRSQRSWMLECNTYGDLPSAIVSAHRIRPLELAQLVSVRPLSLTMLV
jgi:hypothetical protein